MWILHAFYLLVIFVLLMAVPARAEGRFGVAAGPGQVGAEFELGTVPGSFLGADANPTRVVGWLMFGEELDLDSEVGLLAGTSLPLSGISGIGSQSLSSFPFILGLSFRQPWGPLWFRVTPNIRWGNWYVPTLDQALDADLPWFEVDIRPVPHVEVGLRTSVAPVRLGVTW